ncbi:unnamed protein product [Caenorhabditis bovis]|uniref:DUF7747 domain-containing protein n=1 Tax=Caenorhabditis bovis TaxID=2654633 RepID=A0A8S1F296_9PELO|nr:unnamed protein product [Caenorhabditis bovis]
MPRKSANDSLEEESQDNGSKSPAVEVAQEPVSSRPKRNVRKSVLISSGDYEINLPGVNKVEEDDDYEFAQAGALTNESVKKRGRPATEKDVRTAKKKKTEEPTTERPVDETPVNTDNNVAPLTVAEVLQDIVVGAETEVGENIEVQANAEIESAPPFEDEGPAVLEAANETTDMGFGDDDEFSEENEAGMPQLELNTPLGKRRGRPKKAKEEPLEETENNKDKSRSKERVSRIMRLGGDRVVSKSLADRVSGYHVKLFEDEIDVTELGDCYATVINGCLAYLLRKERIIDLLTSPEEISMIREGGWMLDRPPRLPPLVTNKVCFAFYVDGSKLVSIKDISNDDLKPWSSTDSSMGDPVIKPNVRRHPVARVNGRLVPIKGDPRLAELHLTEYSAWLPRLLRLRKKIFYLSREGQIYGNVLILYDYTCPGDCPSIVNLPHGNDYLRTIANNDTDDQRAGTVGDADNPFEDEVVAGPRGGNYLRVRPSKVGWAQNKKLLLKYLINEPGLLDGTELLNRRVPFLPPLIETAGVFVYFVPASFVANQLHHCGDGLSPWTVSHNPEVSSPRVRSIRRCLIQDTNGLFVTTRDQWQLTGLCLVETMSVLARCPRLRKRVFYVQRNNSVIMGNVCYLYEYIREGPIPTIVRPHAKPPQERWAGPIHMNIDNKEKTTMMAPNGEEEQFIDVEDLEVVEEEVVGDMMNDDQQIQEEQDNEQDTDDVRYEEVTEDTLNGGWDSMFDEDALLAQECPEPYYEEARILETGHVYLTVRHKRMSSSFDCVLEWIANTNVVEERGILNYSKPMHPPLVRNMRAYAFFVAGTAIFPHDINRDDFSPWSHNGTPENPTCYRTKVRKVGVICDDAGSQFHIKDIDYKSCPFHLVYLYSINPRDPRLRKKIFYMMETESRLVVSHALIIYDYNVEGPLPRLHGSFMKRFARKSHKRNLHDVENDVSDISETEKESPFILPPQVADDGTMYLALSDMEFWNDRNRHLHFLVNKPNLLENFGCLNNRVPALPPATPGKGAYVFFIDGLEVDSRNLTCDGLVPWSENVSSNPTGLTRRPKSIKYPLALNREGQLRVWRSPPMAGPRLDVEFQMHIYTATLPRCPRLKKKVVYVVKNGMQIGHSMIIYWFTEAGEMPVPITYGNVNPEITVQRMPASVREEARNLLMTNSANEVGKMIQERHGIQISNSALYYLRRREMMNGNNVAYEEVKNEMINNFQSDEWGNQNPQGEEMMIAGRAGNDEGGNEKNQMFDENSIQVGHTEEIQVGQVMSQRHRQTTIGDQLNMLNPSSIHTSRNSASNQPSFFAKSSGNVRHGPRTDTLWRIAKNSLGTTNDNETFDALWKMLADRNEGRLLQMVHQTFGVEIIAGVVEMIHIEEGVPMEEQLVHEINQDGRNELVGPRKENEEDGEKFLEQVGSKPHEHVQMEQVIIEEVNDEMMMEGPIVDIVPDDVQSQMNEPQAPSQSQTPAQEQ